MLGSSAYIDSENSVNRIEDAQYALHNYGAHGNAIVLFIQQTLDW